MANILYNSLNQQNSGQGGMLQQFPQFMRQFRGQDPNQMLNEIVSSGRISQDQLNQVQQRYQQIQGQFNQFKSMFGF